MKTKRSYEEIIKEIGILQDLIKRYQTDHFCMPEGLSYRGAVRKLKYLRNLQRNYSKKS